jgi:hypothetical protein
MKKVLFIALAAVVAVAFCAPAMAADKSVSFYGNVRVWTEFVKSDSDWVKNTDGRVNPNNESDTDFELDMDIFNSRFGANFKEGNLSANVEFRPNNGNPYRQWWGGYDFGGFTLRVGQQWSPLFLAGAVGCDCERGGFTGTYGDMWGSLRQPMAKIIVPFSMGQFVFAAIKPNAPATTATSDTDTTLPKIEMRLAMGFGPADVNFFYGYNKYAIGNLSDTEDVTSYVYGAKASAGMGPFTIAAVLWKGQNTANYGLVGNGLTYSGYDAVNGEDADVYGYFAEAGFAINDMLALQAAYGYTKGEGWQKEKDDLAAMYLRMDIHVAKGVTITPDVGKYDNKEATNAAGVKTDRGAQTFYGVYWQINF